MIRDQLFSLIALLNKGDDLNAFVQRVLVVARRRRFHYWCTRSLIERQTQPFPYDTIHCNV